MELKPMLPQQIKGNVFEEIGKGWMLITAKKHNGTFNTMTASWGQLGVLWNTNIATCYVRPQRHTFSFIEEADYYTLSFFPEEYRPALSLLGTKSGRDLDKIAESGLTPVEMDNVVSFKEAKLALVCRKLYTTTLTQDNFKIQSVVDKHYPEKDFHHVYIGEIIRAYE